MADQEKVPDDPVSVAMHANWLFQRLPPWIVDTLSNEQREAIHQAITDPSLDAPPVNIRLWFPLPATGRRFYLAIMGGEEKRSPERAAYDRNRYPLRTLANIFFFLGLGVLFYMIAIVGLAVQTAIVGF